MYEGIFLSDQSALGVHHQRVEDAREELVEPQLWIFDDPPHAIPGVGVAIALAGDGLPGKAALQFPDLAQNLVLADPGAVVTALGNFLGLVWDASRIQRLTHNSPIRLAHNLTHLLSLTGVRIH